MKTKSKTKKTRYEIEEVHKYMVCDDHVKKALRRHFAENAAKSIKSIRNGEVLYSAEVDIENFLLDLMMNEARHYGEFTGKGSYGKYTISIRGLGGVYFYEAPEFDNVGYFLSIDDAADAIISDWADSLVSTAMECWRASFENPILVKEAALEQRKKAAEARKKALDHARKILRARTIAERVPLWNEMFCQGEITGIKVCADILTKWIEDSKSAESPTQDIEKITSRALGDPVSVFKHLKNNQRWHVVEEIKSRAQLELKAAEAYLQSCHGVARMGAASRMKSAKELGAKISNAISRIESGG